MRISAFAILTLIISSCSGQVSRTPASLNGHSSLSCGSSLTSFSQVKSPKKLSISSSQAESIQANLDYEEIFETFKHPVEKEQVAEILYYIEKEYAQEGLERKKSYFWELFSCRTI